MLRVVLREPPSAKVDLLHVVEDSRRVLLKRRYDVRDDRLRALLVVLIRGEEPPRILVGVRYDVHDGGRGYGGPTGEEDGEKHDNGERAVARGSRPSRRYSYISYPTTNLKFYFND